MVNLGLSFWLLVSDCLSFGLCEHLEIEPVNGNVQTLFVLFFVSLCFFLLCEGKAGRLFLAVRLHQQSFNDALERCGEECSEGVT